MRAGRRRPGWPRFPEMARPAAHGLGSAALAVVLTGFMLLKREDLRNRLIRLAGHGRDDRRPPRRWTTPATASAASCSCRLIVNAGYGTRLGVGLLPIGVEYALLWGFLAAVAPLRPLRRQLARRRCRRSLLSLVMSDGWTQPIAGRRACSWSWNWSRQRHGAVAVRPEHRRVGGGLARVGRLLGLPVGADRPGPVRPADRLPGGPGPVRARTWSSSTCCSATSRPWRPHVATTSGCWPATRTRRPRSSSGSQERDPPSRCIDELLVGPPAAGPARPRPRRPDRRGRANILQAGRARSGRNVAGGIPGVPAPMPEGRPAASREEVADKRAENRRARHMTRRTRPPCGCSPPCSIPARWETLVLPAEPAGPGTGRSRRTRNSRT